MLEILRREESCRAKKGFGEGEKDAGRAVRDEGGIEERFCNVAGRKSL